MNPTTITTEKAENELSLKAIEEFLTGDDYNRIAFLCECSKDYAQKIFKGDREINTEKAKKVYELGKKASQLNFEKFATLQKIACPL
jgi:hypothetical protein